MRRNETIREVLRSLLYIGMIPVVIGLLFLYVWLGEEVRDTAIQLEELQDREIELRGEYNLLRAERSKNFRADHLAKLATEKLNLVQPDPESREIRVELP